MELLPMKIAKNDPRKLNAARYECVLLELIEQLTNDGQDDRCDFAFALLRDDAEWLHGRLFASLTDIDNATPSVTSAVLSSLIDADADQVEARDVDSSAQVDALPSSEVCQECNFTASILSNAKRNKESDLSSSHVLSDWKRYTHGHLQKCQPGQPHINKVC